MVAVPAETPVTTPSLTVATSVSPLIHSPSIALSDRIVLNPAHKFVAPVMESTNGGIEMVTVVSAKAVPHIVAMIYDIVAVPAAIPVTIPEDALTIATEVSELYQLPPGEPVLSVNIVGADEQK